MKLSVVILAKNEEDRIAKAIKSASFADEIIVIDDGSTDKTVAIARKNGAYVFEYTKKNFADARNFGLKKAQNEWILYLDADEMLTQDLAQEIKTTIVNTTYAAFKIPRKNYYLGKAWPQIERLERLFRKKSLQKWYGNVHESPMVKGGVGELRYVIMHDTHRSLEEMVSKTNEWSQIEAQLRFNAHHPRVTWWRFPRLMITAFWQWYIVQGGWKVGTVGLIESMYQAFSIFITYARLWELQNL